MNKTTTVIGFITMMLLIGMNSHAIYDDISIQGKLKNTSTGDAMVGDYAFSINIYNSFIGGSSLYESNKTLTTDSDGIYNTVIESVDLPFDVDYYIGININDTGEMTPRISMTDVGNAIRSNETEYFNNQVSSYYLNNTQESDLNVNSSGYVTGFTEGSIPFADANGMLTENNTHLYYDSSNGGSFAIGSNAGMRNIFQSVKEEGITDLNNVKALIAVRNTGTTDNNFVGYSWQTHDTDGDIFSVARLLAQITSHADDAVSGNLLFEITDNGNKLIKMNLSEEGLYVNGSIKSEDWTNVSITKSQVSDADWWDADGDIGADEISESKIAFSTSCGAGNHYYLNGNDLACEADDDTTYTAGLGLSLVGTEFTHNDSSSQSSSDNSARTYIQDIILDTYGHITSIVTATETVVDTDTQDLSYNTETDVISLTDGGSIDITEVDTNTNANTICSGETTYLDGEGNCDDISSVYRLQSWDNFTGIPTATPSDGDTTHLSNADEIYDWVVSIFQPLEATLTDIADGTINENLINTVNPWADNEVADDITVASTKNISSTTGFVLGDDINLYVGGGTIDGNSTCVIIKGDTSTFNIC